MNKTYFKLALALALAACSSVKTIKAQSTDWVSLATQQVKLDTAIAACIYISDINNDHYPDIVTIRGDNSLTSPDNIRVYMNVQDTASAGANGRMFVDVTDLSGINGSPVPGVSSRGTLVVALADINNDGNVDLVKGNYYHSDPSMASGDHCEVLLGDGRGHFTIVPDNGLHSLGVINVIGFSFLDYDRDGNIDLFIARWFDSYATNQALWSPGILMKGRGDGTFENTSVQAGITQAEPMYGCSVVDWNNDGWPDIATAPYCRTGGQLWKNNGDGTFANVAAPANYNARYLPGDNGQNLCMWNAVPEDFDNDGDMDFFFTLVHGGNDPNEGRSAIMLNGGADNNYTLTADRSRVTRKYPMSSHNGDYDASWLDLDNDGLMDLVMTQGHYMPATDRIYVFHQGQDHNLTDITGDLGLIRTETRDMHSLEAIDYDLDGDDDIIVRRNAVPRDMHLIENRIGQDHNWTGIFLRAPQGVNGSSIGARIYVWSGGVRRMREVYAGRGNAAGQQPFALLFGLGSHTKIDSVQVVWPDAARTTTTVVNPPINRYLEITASGLTIPGGPQHAVAADIALYPNPAQDFILVQLNNDILPGQIQVYDMTGRNISDHITVYNSRGATWYCSLTNLAQGQYLMKVTTREGKTFSRSFVKRSKQ